MKRLMVLAVAAMVAWTVKADTETVDGIEWTYTVSGGEASVGSGGSANTAVPESTTGAITIPSRLGGCPVTSIGSGAFFGCSGLTSVTIPSSVTSIGGSAFGCCSGLKDADGFVIVRDIFCGYYGSASEVAVPNGVKRIDDYAFCAIFDETLKRVTIPSSVTSIGKYAFYGREGLTSVTIPTSVTSIGESAFYRCNGLTSVTIPSSVTSIGSGAFRGCDRLGEILVVAGNKHYISENGVLFNKSKTEIVDYPAGKSGSHYAIPSGVTSIGWGAFEGCANLTSVTIPSSVKSIASIVFVSCDALKTVYVAKGDTKRVKNLLETSGFDTSKVTFVEGAEPTPTPTPEPGPTPESEEAFKAAHTFNGLVTDADGVMCGMVQVATAKKTKKGAVRVSGFLILADGKKQTLKAASGTVSGGQVAVTTKAGKAGELALTVTDEGFTGTLGGMKVASGTVGEETGILSGTLKMSYFDAKTGKVKTKSIKIGGLTDGGEAVGTATVKGQGEKLFEAKIGE